MKCDYCDKEVHNLIFFQKRSAHTQQVETWCSDCWHKAYGPTEQMATEQRILAAMERAYDLNR